MRFSGASVRNPSLAARWRLCVDGVSEKRKRHRRSKAELAVEALCGRVIDTQKVSRLLMALSPKERKLVWKKVAERNAELKVGVLARYYPFGLKS